MALENERNTVPIPFPKIEEHGTHDFLFEKKEWRYSLQKNFAKKASF